MLRAFSAIALWLVPMIALAGVALAMLLLPDPSALWREPYGRLLCVKMTLFALLMVLAALNRQRFAPAIGRGEAAAVVHFRRSVAGEYFLICIVLTVTAAMTGFFSPEPHAGTALAKPEVRVAA
jgi:putative copper export protein